MLKITKFQSVISEKSNFSWPVPIAVHQYGAVLKMALEIWRHGRSVERADEEIGGRRCLATQDARRREDQGRDRSAGARKDIELILPA
ncbi:hypothetical protein [Burkholderia gladioli]|uniref:hypothetical protein n=1 Tax=Burkholderia gladioli TaxID=28095 RepID=UPI00265147D5|nr:hypothetical protein [Burkholderia gladioli]MDN7717623.1 hypothetical protein [Burkholderia gladioli]